MRRPIISLVLIMLALAACATPRAPAATAPPAAAPAATQAPAAVPTIVPPTETPATEPTLAPTATPPTEAPTEAAPAATGVAFQPLSPEACATLAQAMSRKLGVNATQVEAPFSDPGTNQAGVGCQAAATGTGEQLKDPAAVVNELKAVLESEGWKEDNQLASGGPTGMGAGFRKGNEVCLASADWKPAPEANCPTDQPIGACKVTPKQQLYTVSLNCAQSAQSAVGLANPASENCVKQGDTLSIEKRGDGGEYGVCVFEDNMQCEEWALLRGECPVGGVKVTGYVTDAARYCAITGGTYTATGDSNTDNETGTCQFKNGKQCDAKDYFDGKCSATP